MMASVSTDGLDGLIGDLEKIARIPDATILEMLTAEAEVVAAAQETEARSMLSGEYSKGITAEKIDYDKKLSTKGDSKALYVYPKGTRTDGNKRRAAEVAFINEYGANGRNIPARPFIRTANEKSEDAALAAAARVYDDFLSKNNL